MAEFDYADWVAKARAFVERIAGLPGVEVRSRDVDPPLRSERVDRIAAELGLPIPDTLRGFITGGASRVDCTYRYQPAGASVDDLRAILPDRVRLYGGARLCAATDLPDHARSAAEWARETWVADDPGERVLWEAGLPFAALDDGDYLALDTRGGSPDPAVLYLSHDDASWVLTPSFTRFLAQWEQLCYIGPEHWLLQPFIGPDGTLDPRTETAGRLRARFRDQLEAET